MENESKEAVAVTQPKRKKKIIIAVAILLSLLMLAIIGIGVRMAYAWLDTTHITGIYIADIDTSKVERGDTVQLTYSLNAEKNCVKYPKLNKYFDVPTEDEILASANELGEIQWVCADEAIAAVDTSGLVSTIAKGDVDVKVSLGDFSDSQSFHVVVTPTGITATEELKFKKYKEQFPIEYTVIPEDADDVRFSFVSSDESVATVDENGVVTAVKAGKCTITTTLDGYDFTVETAVSVPEPAPVYPLSYSDSGVTINVYKEKYAGSWVYAAHVQMSDYSRMGTACANGKYGGGGETTSHAAKRLGAILAINGDYAAPYLNYPVVRSGQLCNSKGALWCPAVYSRNNGLLINAWETGGTPGYAGADLGSLVSSGAVTDTFSFGPPMLVNGAVTAGSGGGRAQRTFIGSNGAAGDIWLVVADGRKNDGVSAGLTYIECAQYLQSKGCSFGVPLDGGGSSTMVFNGRVLNAERGNERSVVDFVYVR